MSCVPITPEMAWLLDACRSWPIGPEVLMRLREMPEWEQARSWGWVQESGELTGFGRSHASGETPRGIIR
jgi:hypothetical protein